MINRLREVLYKLFEQPHRVHETIGDTAHSAAYTEMISKDLEAKYDGKTFNVPIQLIDFDSLLESLVSMGHPAIKPEVTKPYVKEDFDDLQPDIAELIVDYMNTHLKLLVNSAIQEYLKQDRIKMSADVNGIKYYSDEEDEDIDGLIKLELDFRSV